MPNLAQQAAAELGSLNKKIIEAVPEKMLKSGKPIRIYNVGPWRWIRPMGSLGTFTIPKCEPGKKHSAALEVPYIMRDAIRTKAMRPTPSNPQGKTLTADDMKFNITAEQLPANMPRKAGGVTVTQEKHA